MALLLVGLAPTERPVAGYGSGGEWQPGVGLSTVFTKEWGRTPPYAGVFRYRAGIACDEDHRAYREGRKTGDHPHRMQHAYPETGHRRPDWDRARHAAICAINTTMANGTSVSKLF